MTRAELKGLRERIGISQAEMAGRLDITLRAYSELENREGNLPLKYELAVERVALALAVEAGDPMIAPAGVRRAAIELARIITG